MGIKTKAILGGLATELLLLGFLLVTASFAYGSFLYWAAIIPHAFPGLLIAFLVTSLKPMDQIGMAMVAGGVQLGFWVWLWYVLLKRRSQKNMLA